jgi:hypothetical protein
MERETITLETRAQHRLSVLNHLLTGEITAVEAAAYLEATLSSHQDTPVNPNRDDWPSARSACGHSRLRFSPLDPCARYPWMPLAA